MDGYLSYNVTSCTEQPVCSVRSEYLYLEQLDFTTASLPGVGRTFCFFFNAIFSSCCFLASTTESSSLLGFSSVGRAEQSAKGTSFSDTGLERISLLVVCWMYLIADFGQNMGAFVLLASVVLVGFWIVGTNGDFLKGVLKLDDDPVSGLQPTIFSRMYSLGLKEREKCFI